MKAIQLIESALEEAKKLLGQESTLYDCYSLKTDMLDIKKGNVFIHVKYNNNMPEIGNLHNGALVLAWVNGNCQNGWCGGTIILPGQYAGSEYFKKISNRNEAYSLPPSMLVNEGE